MNLEKTPMNTILRYFGMSKKDRINEARNIINKHSIGDVFSIEDTEQFSFLCGYMFEHVMRVAPLKGVGASVSVICRDEQYQGRWSWVKSIEGYSQRKNLTQAMRHAIRFGKFTDVSKTQCVECGTKDRLSIDHKSIPFSTIASKFIAEFGEPEIENNGEGWQLVKPVNFVSFHDKIADYQVLCMSCNAKKGVGKIL